MVDMAVIFDLDAPGGFSAWSDCSRESSSSILDMITVNNLMDYLGKQAGLQDSSGMLYDTSRAVDGEERK